MPELHVAQEIEVINTALTLALSFIKFLFYLRIYPTFGQIIRLSYDVFFAASSFSIFFYLYNLLIAFEYKILKVDLGGHPDLFHGTSDDYKRIG